jgi:prevent-host-death family protein
MTTGGYFSEMSDERLREVPMPFRQAEIPRVGDIPLEVPVKEAKAQLTALLRMVEAGRRIVLTRHGKPIADLVPHVAATGGIAFDNLDAWHKAKDTSAKTGWIAPDFDDPLPEDFLVSASPQAKISKPSAKPGA